MDVGTLTATLGLDTSNFESGLSGAEGKLGGFGNVLAGVAGGAIVAFGAAMVGAAGAALNFSSEVRDATGNIQAQLGVTAEQAKALGDVAVEVFKNNFGGSLTEAAEAVTEVQRQLGDLVSQDQLQGVTENALRLKDAFGLEVSESVNTVKTLMENFGLTSEQAFDFITKGVQSGMNASGDFLDTIGEYSTQFSNGGATAEQFFGLLESGLQGGVLGTDKAADAFKEFGLRIADGSSGTAAALQGLGINAQQLWADMASGEVTTADAFQTVIEGLSSIEDPVLRNQIGVALIGTQYEDLGASAVTALSLAGTSLEEMAGATAGLDAQYTSLGGVFEGLGRRALVALQPIGDALLSLALAVMPVVMHGFDWFESILPPLITTVSGIINNFVAGVTALFQGPLAQNLTATSSNFQIMQDMVMGVMNALWGIISAVVGQITAFWAANGDSILANVTSIYNQISALVMSVLNALAPFIIGVLTAIGSFINQHGADIQSIFSTAFNNIFTVVSTVIRMVQGIVNTVLAIMRGDFSTAWEEIKGVVTVAIEAVKTIITNNLDLIKTLWSNNSDAIKSKASEVWDAIKTKVEESITAAKNAVSEKIQEAKEAFTTKLDEMLDYVTSMPQRFYDAGKALADNIKDGFMAAIDALIEEARRKLQELADMLPGSEPKDTNSPLYGLGHRGEALVKNFQAGIDRAAVSLPFLDEISGRVNAVVDNAGSGSSITNNYNVSLGTTENSGTALRRLDLFQQLKGR